MSLREADVVRLERAGFRNFCHEEPDGTLRLANIEGRCVFLVDGSCSAYAARPEGCVLYPLIYLEDGEGGEVGLHNFCPYRMEFRFTSGDREWLERSIAAEEIEVRNRLARSRTDNRTPPTGPGDESS